jgi:hypothetical protein
MAGGGSGDRGRFYFDGLVVVIWTLLSLPLVIKSLFPGTCASHPP